MKTFRILMIVAVMVRVMGIGTAFAKSGHHEEEMHRPEGERPVLGEERPELEEQTIGNSVAMAAANATYAQQQANVTYQAGTTQGIADQ